LEAPLKEEAEGNGKDERLLNMKDKDLEKARGPSGEREKDGGRRSRERYSRDDRRHGGRSRSRSWERDREKGKDKDSKSRWDQSSAGAGSKVKMAFEAPVKSSGPAKGVKRKKSEVEAVMEENERRKEQEVKTALKSPYWITEGIVVKVMNKDLGDGKYYKQKGEIHKVHEREVAEVKMLDTGHVLKLDQDQLETVIPAIDHVLKIVNGPYRGELAVLEKVETQKFSVVIRLQSGPSKGKSISGVPYEDVCKLQKT